MNKITQFEPLNINALKRDMQEELNEVAKSYGVVLQFRGTKYSSTHVNFKLEASVVTDGVVQTKEAVTFTKYASHYGLSPDLLNKTMVFPNGTKLKVIGLNTRASQYPIFVLDENSALGKIAVEYLKKAKWTGR